MNDAMLTLVGAVCAVLLLGGAVLVFLGWRARAQAADEIAGLSRIRHLLSGAPVQLMTITAESQLEIAPRLVQWLGLSSMPRFLTDLGGGQVGLSAGDLAQLQAAVHGASRAGRPFVLSCSPQGSARVLLFQGQRQMDHGQPEVAVWVFDATEMQAEVVELRDHAVQLRDAFDALTGLIEAAPLPMWYRGADLRLLMVNSAYVHAVEGADAEDVVQRGVELIEGGGLGGPLANAAIARDTQTAQVQAMPATIEGARRRLRVHDIPMPTGGVAGFAIDIEELEQARAGSQRFAAAQRAMLDRLSAGVAQFGADRTLVFCNQPFRRMFAMRSEWLAEGPEFERVLERMRDNERVPEMRDFPGWKGERRQWFTATSGAIEESWHLSSGTHLRVVAQPLPDGGLLLIFEDRTEQVQLASARDTLLRVRTATFDNLFEALGVFAADGRLQLWNNRFRALWEFDEDFLATHPRIDALTKGIAAKLANPQRVRFVDDLVRQATVNRQQRGGQVAFADGRHFQFAAVPLPDGNALFTMLDVTDSRRMEQALRDRNDALEAADKVKTAFVANMSYELRTPLTSISGFAEMLHDGYAGKLSKDADSYVDAILQSTARLGALIDDVLDLTQGEAEGTEFDRTTVDLAQVARDGAASMTQAARGKQIELAVDVHPSVGRIDGDPRRLRTAIEHLLRQAIANTAGGGRVLLHADGGARAARIVVSDDSEGLDEATIARAFDRLAVTDIARGSDRALGLGLPIAKQFVEAHGGTLELVSELGAGTLVTITLPRR